MLVSSFWGGILLAICFIVVLAVIYALTQTGTPVSVNLTCQNTAQCPVGFFCSTIDQTCIPNGTCRRMQDCPQEGSYCVNGRCQECMTGNQCPINNTCVNGRCQVMTCEEQEDCPAGFFCNIQEGQEVSLCQPERCETNADCTQGMICQEGVCLTPGEVCNTSDDCRDNTLVCIEGRCQQCRQDSDCSEGQCQEGICVTGCTPECRDGTICVQGRCVPHEEPCGQSCNYSTDCRGACSYCVQGICASRGKEVGETCQGNEDCLSGLCLNGVCQRREAECLMGEDNSCPPERPYCVEGRCKESPSGMLCPAEGDCPNGLHCVKSKCMKKCGCMGEVCRVDRDCVRGLVCSNGKCRKKRV